MRELVSLISLLTLLIAVFLRPAIRGRLFVAANCSERAPPCVRGRRIRGSFPGASASLAGVGTRGRSLEERDSGPKTLIKQAD